jgi:hypothetical protein
MFTYVPMSAPDITSAEIEAVSSVLHRLLVSIAAPAVYISLCYRRRCSGRRLGHHHPFLFRRLGQLHPL